MDIPPEPDGAAQELTLAVFETDDLKLDELADLIDVPAVQSLLDDFHELTRIPLAVIDLRGNVLVGAGWSDICTRFHRANPETCRHCVESDTRLTTGVPEGEFRLYKCKNHMWDIATPIMVAGKHVGNVFSGQFFFEGESLDYELFRSQARRYGFDEEEYLAALQAVPRLSHRAVDTAMAFFWKLAKMLSQLGYSRARLARAVAERDSLMDTLQTSEEDLRRAQAMAKIGSWRLDVRQDELVWSDETYRIFGVAKGTPLTYGTFLGFVHEGDREYVDRRWTAALAGRPYDIEHRIVVNGEIKWVREKAELEFVENQNMLGGFGSVQDITERKTAELERERLGLIEQQLGEELTAINEELRAQNDELTTQSQELTRQNEEIRTAQAEIRRLYDAELESTRLSEALNELGNSLTSLVDFSQVLARALYEGTRALRCERGVLEVRESDSWVVKAVRGFPENLVGVRLSDEEASLAASMARIGDVLVIEDASDDHRVNRSAVVRYGTTAGLIVPIHYQGRIRGSLQLLETTGPRKFTPAETDFARKLSVSVALALENGRLYEQQKSIARYLQDSLLDVPSELPGLRVGHLYRSATELSAVGGDFYDVFAAKGGKVGILIGDVSGHGVEAARIAVMVKDTVRAFFHQFRRPHLVFRETNRLLVEREFPGFVTAFLGVVDSKTGRLTYCCAGHPGPLVSRNGDISALDAPAAPLGAFPGSTYRDRSFLLSPEHLLFLYTDGFTEARKDGELFGEARLKAQVQAQSRLDPEQIPSAVLNEVLAFSEGVLADDVAALAIRLSGERKKVGA